MFLWRRITGDGRRPMFRDEAAILTAAATLAAARFSQLAGTTREQQARESPVDVLINLLREMESKKLIPPNLAPRG
jgi:hypothetical protein